ncbi:MAG: hypothetical protein LBD77_00845 [Bifidobacteriaceae bacterium]|jgi:hypothetical protein|nr:hypothetical protein [Bifidobacteriaceae bacterium]
MSAPTQGGPLGGHPNWLFGLKPNATPPDRCNNDALVRDALSDVCYGHLRLGQNDFEFALNMGAFFSHNEPRVRAWLSQISSPDPKRPPDGQAFNVLVSPLTSRNAAFVAAVNEEVFKGAAQVVGVDVEAEFKDSFAVRYADLRALRRDLEGTGLRLVLHYVDDATVRGLSLLRLRSLVTELFGDRRHGGGEDSQRAGAQVFHSVFVLVDRWSPNTWRNLLQDFDPLVHSYLDIWAPHLNTFTSVCPVCQVNDHLHKAEDGCATALLAGEIRSLRMRETEPIRFDRLIAHQAEPAQDRGAAKPRLIRCSNGQPMPEPVPDSWKGRQEVGRRRLWWRHLLTYGLRHLGSEPFVSGSDQSGGEVWEKDLINCPSIVAAYLITKLDQIARGRPSEVPGTPAELPVDHFAAAIWAATTGELADRKSVREAALAVVNGLILTLLKPPRGNGDWAAPPAPGWTEEPVLAQVQSAREQMQNRWARLVKALDGLAKQKEFDRSMSDTTAWESLLRCLMRATSELGGTLLLRRDTMIRVFACGASRGVNLQRLMTYYVYCLKLLTSRGPDRAKSAFLDYLLLSGSEVQGKPTSLPSPQVPSRTVGQQFVDAPSNRLAIPDDIKARLAEFVDLAYIENTKCLEAVIDDMGPLSAGQPSEADGHEYLPEYSAECLTGWRWQAGSGPDLNQAHELARLLRETADLVSPNHHSDPHSAYDRPLSKLNELWAFCLGKESAKCEALLALETPEDTLALSSLETAPISAGSAQPAFVLPSSAYTQYEVELEEKPRHVTLGQSGVAHEVCAVQQLAQEAKVFEATWQGTISSGGPVVGLGRQPVDAGAGTRPSIVFGLSAAQESQYPEAYCLIRLGLTPDRGGSTEATLFLHAGLENDEKVDAAKLMNAVRIVAIFRGRMLDRLRSEQRRGVLDSVITGKLIEQAYVKQGALDHGQPSDNIGQTTGLAKYIEEDTKFGLGGDGPGGRKAYAQALSGYVNSGIAQLNRAVVIYRSRSSTTSPQSGSLSGLLESLGPKFAAALPPRADHTLTRILSACRSLPGLQDQSKLWLGRPLTKERQEAVEADGDRVTSWINKVSGEFSLRQVPNSDGDLKLVLTDLVHVTVVASLVDSAARHGAGPILVEVDEHGYLYVTNQVRDDFDLESIRRGLARDAGISLPAVADLFYESSGDDRNTTAAHGQPRGVRIAFAEGRPPPPVSWPGRQHDLQSNKWLSVGVPLFQRST